MDERKLDKTKIDPLSGAENKEPAEPLESVPEGAPANATTAEIPGTGEVIRDVTGREARRNVNT